MAGTIKGGQQAAESNKKRYGEDFYQRIGGMGGKLGTTGGFAYVGPNGEKLGRAWARHAGSKGGKISKRGPAKHYVSNQEQGLPRYASPAEKNWINNKETA